MTTQSFNDFEAEHIRSTILRLLARQPTYQANDSILKDSVSAYGFNLTRDRIKTEIEWLAEQRLITTEAIDTLTVATATQRGVDVAEGRATVPGVKRPSAG